MIFSARIDSKSIGTKHLFSSLEFHVADKEKVALIGRNGVGKTTLFNMLSGADTDFHGEIVRRRGLTVMATQQEHHAAEGETAIGYVLAGLPEYGQLKRIIDTHPQHMGDDLRKIQEYSEALDRFNEKGFFTIEGLIERSAQAFQLPDGALPGEFARLSGGQKRFVELIKVMVGNADLALIDEPTNHMDYVAKEVFNEWLKAVDHAVVVISHDRDVLQNVDRIIEIKDKKAYSFTGNYDAYLKQNSTTTVTAMNQYEVAQRSIENIKKQIQYARSRKASWSGTADKKNPFVVMENRLTKELRRLQTEVQKPSVWIDRESVSAMHAKAVEKYDKYKDRNIRIGTASDELRRAEILSVDGLSLGYADPLFHSLSLRMSSGDRIQLKGRNGAGKTTLIQTILAAADGRDLPAVCFAGTVEVNPRTTIGVYDQEIAQDLLPLTLGEAIGRAYDAVGRRINDQQLRQLLASYLFDPATDAQTPLDRLSGGQKARFQLIAMLAGDPDLLVLDEPTNHLDLPSIEELEDALERYAGAILYVSHDSYFARNLPADVVELTAV